MEVVHEAPAVEGIAERQKGDMTNNVVHEIRSGEATVPSIMTNNKPLGEKKNEEGVRSKLADPNRRCADWQVFSSIFQDVGIGKHHISFLCFLCFAFPGATLNLPQS